MAASRAPTASPRDRLPSTLDPPTRPRFWQRSGAREETGLGPKPDLRPSNKYKPHPLRPEVKAGKPSACDPRQTITMVTASVATLGLAGGAIGVPAGRALRAAVEPATGRAACLD